MATARTVLRAMQCLVFLALLSLCLPCFGENVVVHVLNRKTGQPLPRQIVVVHFVYPKTVDPKDLSTVLQFETDSHGQAQFAVPRTVPEAMDVQVKLSDEVWHCSCQVRASTEKVIREGVAQTSLPRRWRSPESPVQPGPGQIVFVARPTTLLDRVIYP